MKQAIILAGGLGTRMYPLSQTIPKFLLPIAGKPFAHWLLQKLADSKFDQVVLCIGHLGDKIQSFVGDGYPWNVNVVYSIENPEHLLGTAGAIKNASALLANEFIVTYGDSYLPFDYSLPLEDLRQHPDALATMTVYQNHHQYEPSNTRISNDWVIEYNKRSNSSAFDHIDYGVTAFRRSVIDALPDNIPIGLDQIQSDLALRHQMRAWIAKDRFFEIGSPQGYVDLEQYIASQKEFL